MPIKVIAYIFVNFANLKYGLTWKWFSLKRKQILTLHLSFLPLCYFVWICHSLELPNLSKVLIGIKMILKTKLFPNLILTTRPSIIFYLVLVEIIKYRITGCLQMTSTGLFYPALNSSCNAASNKQSCQYRGTYFLTFNSKFTPN